MIKSCALCNCEIGFFTSKTEIANGYICKKCLKNAGISDFENAFSFTCNTAKEMLDRRIPLVKAFKVTKKCSEHLHLDERQKAFRIKGQIFEYSNLLDFQFFEDGQALAVDKLGTEEASVGGLLFGGVGALVGAVAGTKLVAGICNSMELKIILKNTYMNAVTISFITDRIRKRSDEYKKAKKDACSVVAALVIIADYNKQKEQLSTISSNINVNLNTNIDANTTISGADEIIKYKTLLDAGIISQEEFDAKKKQILEN